MKPLLAKWTPALPYAVAGLALLSLSVWLTLKPRVPLDARVPGADNASAAANTQGTNPVYLGKLIAGPGTPSDLPGEWPRFRGATLDNISKETTPLARSWPVNGPRQLWSVDLGEGYAGPVTREGRVYVMDYDQANKQDALRCLSAADGKEIWRFAYPMKVKRNHGMSRTVPTLYADTVIAMGPKCHVVCLDAKTGQLRWGLDLPRQFGTTVPEWYAGQCPLVHEDKLILGLGGTNALMAALNPTNAQVIWTTPNPNKWQMTHSSVMPAEIAGRKQYVYCANKGVVGVAADDGKLLWEFPDWKITMANVPTPVPVGGNRILLSGGYNAGSLMLELNTEADRLVPKTVFRLPAKTFGAKQHTPILYKDHLFAVRDDEQLACLDLSGKLVWASGAANKFGYGPFMVAGGLIYALTDRGVLKLVEPSSDKYNAVAQAQILHGHEAWGPLAIAGGRLLARDSTKLVCVDVAGQ